MQRLLICMLLFLVALGCSSTESRMREHAAMFAVLPHHAQQRLLDGRIALGDTREMVYIAMGGPARQHARKDESGQIIEQWIYTATTYTTYDFPTIILPGIEEEDAPSEIDVANTYDETRIIFEGGKVTSIDRLNQ